MLRLWFQPKQNSQSRSGLKTPLSLKKPRSSGKAQRLLQVRIHPAVTVAVLLFVWQLCADPGVRPRDVGAAGARWAMSGHLFSDLGASLARVTIGLCIAFLSAFSLVLVELLVPPLCRWLDWVIEILRPIPPIVWGPVAILLTGGGEAPAIAVVSAGAFFPAYLALQDGVRRTPREYLMVASTFGASPWKTVWRVQLRAALPSALAGVRLAIGMAWFCVVAAEMLGASAGVGFRVQLFSVNLQTADMLLYVLVIGAMGALLSHGLSILLKKIEFGD